MLDARHFGPRPPATEEGLEPKWHGSQHALSELMQGPAHLNPKHEEVSMPIASLFTWTLEKHTPRLDHFQVCRM